MSELKLGDIVWTISGSNEDELNGDGSAKDPTEVKITRFDEPTHGSTLHYVELHQFDPDTGVINPDSDATYWVREDKVYRTELKACNAFIDKRRIEMHNALRNIETMRRQISEAELRSITLHIAANEGKSQSAGDS